MSPVAAHTAYTAALVAAVLTVGHLAVWDGTEYFSGEGRAGQDHCAFGYGDYGRSGGGFNYDDGRGYRRGRDPLMMDGIQ